MTDKTIKYIFKEIEIIKNRLDDLEYKKTKTVSDDTADISYDY